MAEKEEPLNCLQTSDDSIRISLAIFIFSRTETDIRVSN